MCSDSLSMPATAMDKDSEKALSLTNGSKAESPDDDEKDPCLPGANSRATPAVEPVGRRRLSRTDSVGKKNTHVHRMEEVVRSYTGLTRPGLVVALVVILLLVIFVFIVVGLGVAWPRTPHSQLFPVCTHAACLHASAQILPRMNSSAQPCDNFWNYACGRWLVTQPLPQERSQWSLAEERAFKYRQHVHNLVTTLPHTISPTSLPWKLRHLYESCLQLDSVETDGERPLKRLITQIGGWYVLREFSVHSWEYKNTMVQLQSVYGVSPFFHVGVVPDPRNPDKSMVQITPSGMELPDPNYYEHELSDTVPSAYRRYMKDVVQLLGATSTEAGRFGSDIFHYEKRIAEITPDPTELRNPIANRHISTLGELALSASSIPLLDILQAMFPKAGFSDKTEILVPTQHFLNNVSHIISNTDRSALNNYLMWVFASKYLPYLSTEYSDVISMYRGELTGAEKPLQRWEMCVSTLQRFMGFALAALSDKAVSSKEREATNAQVSEMFEYIRGAIKTSVAKAAWLRPELRRHALEKIDTLSLQVGFPQKMLSTEYLESYYTNLHVHKNNLFQNVINAVEFELGQRMTRLLSPQEEHRWIDEMSTENSVTYSPTANKVVVPQRLLTLPFFHAQYPKSLLYGGLGVQLASAISASVLPFGILYNGDGSLVMPDRAEANQTMDMIARFQRTMVQDLAPSGLASRGAANRTALDTVRHITAVRHARTALTEALAGLPHIHQPGMEMLESDHLFFLTYAQNLCSHATSQQVDLDATSSFHLNSSQLLQTTLKQVPEFSHAFNCESSSRDYTEIL